MRREDNAWADDPAQIEFANSDTFHLTNCTPQHEAFNRSKTERKYGGITGLWGSLEDLVKNNRAEAEGRASIFAGPVLADDDPVADFGNGPCNIRCGSGKSSPSSIAMRPECESY